MSEFPWKRILLFCLVGVIAVYFADYLLVRLRMPSSIKQVEVQHFLAVPLKNGKYEFDYTGNEMVPCVHSFLPHLGYAPCWYLERHRSQAEKI